MINKIVKTFQTVVFVVLMFWITGKFVVTTFDMVCSMLGCVLSVCVF